MDCDARPPSTNLANWGGSFEQYDRTGAISRRGVISNGQWSGPLQDLSQARYCKHRPLNYQKPAQFPKGQLLKTLNLGSNELTTLPENFAELSQLHTLWLYRNPLTGLPQSFGDLPNLKFLHLGNVPWTTPPACIWELKNLEVLWIASSSLVYLPPDVARRIFGMTQLTELRVRDNPLPDGMIDRLREALPNTTIY